MQTKSGRLLYIDWLRGVGALIMLQGHVFHSFLRTDLRDGGPYILSQFVGGMPPAIFLFLTGVTLGFMMHSGERKGLSGAARVWRAVRRSGYLFGIAFLFRLQLWLFGWPDSNFNDVFRVDILNAMGFGILMMSPLALVHGADRIRAAALAGVAIAALSPVVSQLNWSVVPAIIRDYIVPNYNYFSFFPWAAYLAFGVSTGSMLRVLKAEHLERAMQWSALTGVGVIVAAYYFSTLPYSLYTKSEFWLNSPAQVLIKQGVLLLGMSVAFLWTEYGWRGNFSWVRQLGTTSLLVYWVHIELVYGRWLWFFKEKLEVGQTVVAAVTVILFMLLLSVAKTHRDRWMPAVANFFSPAPARISGD